MSRKLITLLCVTALGAAACGDDDACDADPGAARIRRMTRTQYNNTIFDLLGDYARPADAFAAEEVVLGFDNNADALGVTQLLAEQYLTAAEQVSQRATADLAALLPCDPAADGEDECARQFVAAFGLRAWRRPLGDEELAPLMAVFAAGRMQGDFRQGIALAMQVMLQSPHFLYRVELGQPPNHDDSDPAAPRRLTSWEMASRLSYLLWNSMPDEELFDAAAGDRLTTEEQVAAQAVRMLGDWRTRDMVVDFHKQWLALGELADLEKETTGTPEHPPEYPDWDYAFPAFYQQSIEKFIDHVVWEDGGDVGTLLTAPYTFMNARLATYYGAEGPTGDELELVELDPARAAGVLTQPGLLAVLAKPNQSSPVHRGKFVREQLLCQQLDPPPPNIEITPPDLDPALTTRERFREHSANEFCAGCHRLMDPIGLGFEHYDGTGRWRDDENGLPIDSTGEVLESDVAGPFDGPAALAQKLASSEQVRDCVATQWFRYAYGRVEGDLDTCSLTALKRRMRESHGNIRDLLVGLTQTDAFLYLPGPASQGGAE